MAVVNFGGITFDGASLDPGFGLRDLVGWYDGAPVRRTSRERPTSDGNFGVDRYYRDARVITLEGTWTGSDIGAAFEARAQLEAVQADGVPSPFMVTDHFGVRTAMVRLGSEPQVSGGIFSPRFTYAFEVIADDPRKYGAELAPWTGMPTSGTGTLWPAVWTPGYEWGTGGDPGRVSATNDGTATTYPVLEVLGGLSSGVELVELITGSYLRLARPIPAGSRAFFDTRTGGAYIDSPSNDVTGLLTRRDWPGFAIPAGATRSVQFNGLGVVSGTPRLTVRYAPAY